MSQLYYTITYSPDDHGYYAEVFDRGGQTITESPVHETIAQVKAEISVEYPGAQHVKLLPQQD